MTFSDNTTAAESLDDFFIFVGKTGFIASKQIAKVVLKNTVTAL